MILEWFLFQGGSKEAILPLTIGADCGSPQQGYAVNISDDDIKGARQQKRVHQTLSSDEDESSTTKKSRTYKAHAEDASKIRIAALQVTISKLEQSENRGLLTESGYAELQEAKKSIKKETMNLEKLKSNQKASKNIGKRKKKLFKLW